MKIEITPTTDGRINRYWRIRWKNGALPNEYVKPNIINGIRKLNFSIMTDLNGAKEQFYCSPSIFRKKYEEIW